MSLVGSLEDLGLGDILQIVSLSRKSGMLMLRSGSRRGRIVMVDGQVRAGCVEGEPATLREILVDGGVLSEEELKRAADASAASGTPLLEVVSQQAGVDMERLDSLRREQVEQAVLTMLGWRNGDFSFDVQGELDPRDDELLLPSGINAQYLAMEATRLGDETDDEEQTQPEPAEPEPVFSGEEPDVAARVPVLVAEEDESTEVPVLDGEAAQPELEPEVETEPAEPLAPVFVDDDTEIEAAPTPPAVPLVVVDPDLAALEWLKSTATGLFARIHIFQDPEAGAARVRQYLSRNQRPVVLLRSGNAEAAALIQRLQALAPGMVVLPLRLRGEAGSPGAPGVERPPTHEITGRPGAARLRDAAEVLRRGLAPWGRPSEVERSEPPAEGDALERLKDVSQKLRDPSSRGDVLSLVLEFAAGCFSRVAIFMVRDGLAFGMAQRGLERAGGPNEALLREVQVATDKPTCFRQAVEQRASFRGAPEDSGDRRLVELLGERIPGELYVAPIESGGEVAALLYADNLPEGQPLADTTALEIVLHEAGLALDRALLERALEAAEPPGEGPDAGA